MSNQWENMGSTSHKVKPEDQGKDLTYNGKHQFGEAGGMVVDVSDPEEVKKLSEEE